MGMICICDLSCFPRLMTTENILMNISVRVRTRSKTVYLAVSMVSSRYLHIPDARDVWLTSQSQALRVDATVSDGVGIQAHSAPPSSSLCMRASIPYALNGRARSR